MEGYGSGDFGAGVFGAENAAEGYGWGNYGAGAYGETALVGNPFPPARKERKRRERIARRLFEDAGVGYLRFRGQANSGVVFDDFGTGTIFLVLHATASTAFAEARAGVVDLTVERNARQYEELLALLA